MKIPATSHFIDPSLSGLDAAELFQGSRRVASAILCTTHTLACVPLFVIVVLQDVHLKMAVVLNTAVCLCLAVGNYWFYRMQVVKVYPKSLDAFLLLFYGSLIPVACLQHDWLQYWVAVFHHGVVAGFMWLSVLAPCWDNFTMQSLRDNLPQQMCALPGTQRCAVHASQLWAGALTLMALVALGPTLSGQNSPWCATRIVCNYALGLLALLVAVTVQRWVLSRGVAAAQEWQQTTDTEAGLHVAVIGPAAATVRPLGPFTGPLYPIASFGASQAGLARSSAHSSNDIGGSTSSGSDAAPVYSVATVPDADTAAGRRQAESQLHKAEKTARAAAAHRPAA